MGHDHVDRYGERNGVHYFIVNSATNAYSGGAYFYEDPLYSFVTIVPKGKHTVEGKSTIYKGETPVKSKLYLEVRYVITVLICRGCYYWKKMNTQVLMITSRCINQLAA